MIMTTGEWITVVVVVAGVVANFVNFADSVRVLKWRVRRIEKHLESKTYRPLPSVNGEIGKL